MEFIKLLDYLQQRFVLFRKALAKTSVHRIRCGLSKSPSLATRFHKIRKAKNYGSHCSSDVLVHLARVEYENNLRIPKSLEKVSNVVINQNSRFI
ncbi:hypothetical protein ACS0TY_002859 [Phlomoides rotata]